MTRSIRTNQFGYPQGVPTPYTMHVHPYPTRFHGGIWTRPVFGFPQIARTSSVMVPGYDIAGLGRVPARRSVSGWNVGNGIFRPGGYGGGVFDGNISGLGSNAADYPWMEYSDKTLALQKATNTSLRDAGYCTITEDGKLGPATCGARAQLSLDYAGRTVWHLPDTCPDDGTPYVWPRKVSKGCSATPIVAPPSSPPPPSTPPSTATISASSMSMSSSTKKALAFMAGGLLAAAAVVLLKKKRSGTAK